MIKFKKIIINFIIYYSIFNYKYIYKKSYNAFITNPKISIFLPVFNKGKYLKAAISSLQRQTLKDIEIIGINDGSLDESLKILKKISKKDKRIRILNNDRNHGPLYSRAMGISNSSGEYLLNLDADDKLLNDNSLKLIYNLAKSSNSDFCRFLIKRIPANSSESNEFNLINKIQLQLEDLLITNKIISRSIFYKAFIFLKNRIFKEKWMLHDDNIWNKLINEYSKKSIIFNKYIYYYKRNSDSLNLKRGSSDEIKSLVYKLEMSLNINESMSNSDFRAYINQIIDLYNSSSCRIPEIEVKNKLKSIVFKYAKFNKINDVKILSKQKIP